MTTASFEQQNPAFDVAVIGGGAAGLTAAVTLGRSRRSVVLVDSGAPRNAPSSGIHMFLTRDGMTPAEFIAAGRREVESYGGVLVAGEAVTARRAEQGFEVSLQDGREITARRLVVTTGLVDELPDVPGVRELWGRDVHHCAYCHGHELHGQAVGVLGTGPRGVHLALLFRQVADDVVLFRHTAPALTNEEAEQLAARGIRVIEGQVDSLDLVDGRLAGVRLRNGDVVARQALVVGPRFVARSQVLADLGLTPTAHPMGGEYIAADPMGATEVPGVWVAGNVTDLMGGVVAAAAGGMLAASAINADLIAEDTRVAVDQYRAYRSDEIPASTATLSTASAS